MENQNGTKNTITLSTLLSIGTILISLGINFLQSNQYVEGVACIIVGFGIICIGVYLFERGLIDKFKQFVGARKRGRPRKE